MKPIKNQKCNCEYNENLCGDCEQNSYALVDNKEKHRCELGYWEDDIC